MPSQRWECDLQMAPCAGRPEFQRDAIPATKGILPGAHNRAHMEFSPQDWCKAIAQQEAPLSCKHSRTGRTGLKDNSCSPSS